jgi:hypothetical protein
MIYNYIGTCWLELIPIVGNWKQKSLPKMLRWQNNHKVRKQSANTRLHHSNVLIKQDCYDLIELDVSQTIGYIFYSTIANNISEKYTYIYHYSLEKKCFVQYNILSQTKEFEQMPTSRFLYE